MRALATAATQPAPREPEPFQTPRDFASEAAPMRVSALVPTLERYPYLQVLLRQLREQTHGLHEIIVVDQTPLGGRDTSWIEEFSDLPLRVLHRDEAGQCSSRNAGLQLATGEAFLLLDDDIEVETDFVASLAGAMQAFGADSVSGVAHEVGAGALPAQFAFTRVSDVFPAGITLVKRAAIERAGLFDLAYDRGQRADGDLGMRVCASGHLMMLVPQIWVLHHHAPRGGLRSHGARVHTRGASRQKIGARSLLSVSDFYLYGRYFGPARTREMFWIMCVSSLSGTGSKLRRVLKLLAGLRLMPDTVRTMRRRARAAGEMRQTFPQIPRLEPETGVGPGG